MNVSLLICQVPIIIISNTLIATADVGMNPHIKFYCTENNCLHQNIFRFSISKCEKFLLKVFWANRSCAFYFVTLFSTNVQMCLKDIVGKKVLKVYTVRICSNCFVIHLITLNMPHYLIRCSKWTSQALWLLCRKWGVFLLVNIWSCLISNPFTSSQTFGLDKKAALAVIVTSQISVFIGWRKLALFSSDAGITVPDAAKSKRL